MKALSIRQPWAWFIIEGHKPVENRTWYTDYRGALEIHAAAGMTVKEYDDALKAVAKGLPHIAAMCPHFDDLPRGGFIGNVELYGCVQHFNSPWFSGPYGLLLRNPIPWPLFPYKGALGTFDISGTPFIYTRHPDFPPTHQT